MYELAGEDPVLYDWIGQGQEPLILELVLAWLPKLAENPHGLKAAVRLRPGKVPCMTTRVLGTDTFIDYTVIEEPPVVILVDMETVTI